MRPCWMEGREETPGWSCCWTPGPSPTSRDLYLAPSAVPDPPPVTDATGEADDDHGVEAGDDPEPFHPRGHWSGKLDFFFSCISYAVGLGNVWRFPYLCYENGGGAFLVPFFLSIAMCGIPMFILEVSMGQYLSTGGIGIWNLVPLLKGVGFASMIMIGLCNIYYIVLVAYTLFYLVSSFTYPLPWERCGNAWNSDKCIEPTVNMSCLLSARNLSLDNSNSPVKEFWENRVLGITDGLEDMGSVRWELALYLLFAWILVYVVVWRGLHQSGKIVWFTATFPYIILLILLGRGASLEGATQGLAYYLKPEWTKLREAKVWVAAGTQVLFSYGIGIGANIALGSYNRYRHNFYRDSLLVCCISSGTSLFSGLVIFSVLGHMAHIQQKDVSKVAQSGPGLAFLAYPEVVVQLPGAPLWAVLFFLMLITLGIDSQFCTVEALITGIVDEFPKFLYPHRKLFTFLVVLAQFLLGLPLVMQGGMYLFQLMDFFSASGFTLLTVVFFELVGLAWIYGNISVFGDFLRARHLCQPLFLSVVGRADGMGHGLGLGDLDSIICRLLSTDDARMSKRAYPAGHHTTRPAGKEGRGNQQQQFRGRLCSAASMTGKESMKICSIYKLHNAAL